MAGKERKELVWAIKKGLFHLSADEVFQLATNLPQTLDHDPATLIKQDEEGCVVYVSSYMGCSTLLELEDEGLSELLGLKDQIDEIIEKRVHSPVTMQRNVNVVMSDVNAQPLSTSEGVHPDTYTTPVHTDTHTANLHFTDMATEVEYQQLLISYNELGRKLSHYESTPDKPLPSQGRSSVSSSSTSHRAENMIPIRDLPLFPLHRREFKIQGGQIGDSTSDISYTSIAKQIDEGLAENHSVNDIIRGVFRIIKPGNFKDMLVNKEVLSVPELKSFLQSHLNERNSSELFQELMCGKQSDHETPQQFLYRIIGLKQKLIFTCKQATSDFEYEAQTIQNVFLRTVYQGLGTKHNNLRTELKPLLTDKSVTDDALLRQIIKITSDESERQRRLGQTPRHKVTQANSVQLETDQGKGEETADQKGTTKTIQQLSAQVEALTTAMDSLRRSKTPEHVCECRVSHSRPAPPHSHGPSPPSHQPSPHSHQPPPDFHQPSPHNHRLPQPQRRPRQYGCPGCLERGLTNCSHCFRCGEEGHRALGCLKRTEPSGNGPRSLRRDNQ